MLTDSVHILIAGQCSWEPPVGAFVVPRSPDGEWWELADASRNNRSYYYSASSLSGRPA